MRILIVNGPNLNFLGKREKNIYGNRTYDDLIQYLDEYTKSKGIDVIFYQSNSEGAIIDKLYEVYENVDAIIINGGAYAHTSIAIMDCLKGINKPLVNVHLTDVNLREEYRHQDYLALVADKTCMGKGFESYIDAINYLIGKE